MLVLNLFKSIFYCIPKNHQHGKADQKILKKGGGGGGAGFVDKLNALYLGNIALLFPL